MGTAWNEILAYWLYVTINSTLHVSVLICLVLGIKAIGRRYLAPRWHYTLWLLVLAKLLIPWGPTSPASLFNLLPEIPARQVESITFKPMASASPSPIPLKETAAVPTESIQVASEIDATPMPAAPHPSIWSSPLLWGLIWLVGALCLAGYILLGHLSLWRVIVSERAVTDQSTLELLEDCRAHMGTKTFLGVVASEHVKGPALFGFIRPRLVLPAQLTRQFRSREMKYIFYHELAHLKRHDIAVGWLVALAQILHWFNPLVWLAFHVMRIDRELACDRLALDYMNNRRETKRYGFTIIRLLENFVQDRQLAALAAVSESRAQLRNRIRMIAGFQQRDEGLAVWPLVFLGVLIPVILTTAQTSHPSLYQKRGSRALEEDLVPYTPYDQTEADQAQDHSLDGQTTTPRINTLGAEEPQALHQRLQRPQTELTEPEQAAQTQRNPLAGHPVDQTDAQWNGLEAPLNIPSPAAPLTGPAQGPAPQQGSSQGALGLGGFAGGMAGSVGNGQPNFRSFNFQRSFNVPAGGFRSPQQMRSYMAVQSWLIQAEQARQMLRLLQSTRSQGQGNWRGVQHTLDTLQSPAQALYAASASAATGRLPGTAGHQGRNSPRKLTTQALYQCVTTPSGRARLGKLASQAKDTGDTLAKAVAAQDLPALTTAVNALEKRYTQLITLIERSANMDSKLKVNTFSSRPKRHR